jgi:hypothetical protein
MRVDEFVELAVLEISVFMAAPDPAAKILSIIQ